MGLGYILRLRGLELIECSQRIPRIQWAFAASPAPMAAYETTGLVIPQLVSGHRAAPAKYLGAPPDGPIQQAG